MANLRVLLIDDSVVVRRLLTEIISAEPDMEVVGVAATASIGIQKITQVQPDVIVLDVEMPEMDGIEAVGRIRETWTRLPVLMCSSLTERGADVTLRALSAGASDYVAKPSGSNGASLKSGSNSLAEFRTQLVMKLRVLGGRDNTPRRVVLSRPARPQVAPARTPVRVSAIAIGSSTGGPTALATVFAKLTKLPVPIFIVQHMPPLFTRMLAERLTAGSVVPVKEVADGDVVEPGRAYIAPGGYHMVVSREGTTTKMFLNQDPPENSCRPAVDVLFRSVARVYGGGVLGVVLTGMGHDGTRGARDIVEAGGLVITQDAASCVVPSMPTSVAGEGLSDAVLPIELIGAEIITRTNALTNGGASALSKARLAFEPTNSLAVARAANGKGV